MSLEELFTIDLLGLPLYSHLAIVVAGLLAGIVNTIAGGGSLIALPVLIFTGLPATVANGTNRLGVLFGSGSAAAGFHSEKVLDWKLVKALALPSSIGAVAGAWLSTDISDRNFQIVIGVAMILATAVIFWSPKKWFARREQAKKEGGEETTPTTWREGRTGAVVRFLTFVAIGFYGGFVQAGVGVFLISGLVLVCGKDLVRANGVKVVLVFIYTLVAFAVFVWADLVAWLPAVTLALGSMVGGWIGSKLTASWGPKLVKWVLLAVVLISASRLFGLW